MSNSHFSPRWRALGAGFALALWASFALLSCSAPQRPAAATCNLPQSVHLRVDASDRLNLDDRGRSLPTIVRVYQLKNIARLENAEFNDIWQHASDTLADDLVDTVEMTVYPRGHVARSFTRNPEALYVAAVAIVRHPAGISWRSVYELGPAPGTTRCAAQQRDPQASPAPPPDPRFFFYVEDYRIEGRDEPPEPARPANNSRDGGLPQLPGSAPSAPEAPQAPNATPPPMPGGTTLLLQPGTDGLAGFPWSAPFTPRARVTLVGVVCRGATGARWGRPRRAEAATS